MPLKNLQIIDPYKIDANQCPIFIQSGDMRSLFGWGIRARTSSNFNHSMVMRVPGKVVSQSWTYKEFDIKPYLKKGIILKFWKCVDITDKERVEILMKINYDLMQPWYKKMYDIPGIVGQLFGIRWFNVSALNYCSERVAKLVKIIIPEINKHPTPEDIDILFKNSKRMEIIGYHFLV